MAQKNIKIYYYYPLRKINGTEKIVDLKPILEGLMTINCENRILNIGEEIIQLKQLSYCEETKRWELAFLRNIVDAPFKSKLNDNTDTADTLEEDEFVGHECCAIYDEESKILCIQNNKNSVSFGGIANFLNQYTNSKIYLSVLTYTDEYCNIIEDDHIDYRSIIIGYTDISKIQQIADTHADDNTKKVISSLCELSNSMAALNGKIELNVGRSKSRLNKFNLAPVVNLLKKDKDITKNLKVKMFDGDNIRLIDLLNNKVYHDCKISVTKSEPKTFQRILDNMHESFDDAIKDCFDKCIKFTNS